MMGRSSVRLVTPRFLEGSDAREKSPPSGDEPAVMGAGEEGGSGAGSVGAAKEVGVGVIGAAGGGAGAAGASGKACFMIDGELPSELTTLSSGSGGGPNEGAGAGLIGLN